MAEECYARSNRPNQCGFYILQIKCCTKIDIQNGHQWDNANDEHLIDETLLAHNFKWELCRIFNTTAIIIDANENIDSAKENGMKCNIARPFVFNLVDVIKWNQSGNGQYFWIAHEMKRGMVIFEELFRYICNANGENPRFFHLHYDLSIVFNSKGPIPQDFVIALCLLDLYCYY